MKILSFIILSSLLLLTNCYNCYASYLENPSVESCARLSTYYVDNVCCLIHYKDGKDDEDKDVCYEMNARKIVYFDDYKKQIKDEIRTYGIDALEIDSFSCLSKFLKIAYLSILLFLL